jgi:hypothetical protein
MKLKNLVAATALAAFTLVSSAAIAGDVKVTCEKRANRSRASVDGSNLDPGSYRAVLKSGTKTVTTSFQVAIGDEAQFDFDSNQADIADGATALPLTFIVNGRVKGYLVNESNLRATPLREAICRVRN